jgi:hypothetical protein
LNKDYLILLDVLPRKCHTYRILYASEFFNWKRFRRITDFCFLTECHHLKDFFLSDILCNNLEFSCDLGRNRLDTSDQHKLSCNGRPCAKCHKCSDWYFTGHQTLFDRIRDYKHWTSIDWNRYHSDKICNFFKKRDGAACSDDFGPPPDVIHRNGRDFRRTGSYLDTNTGATRYRYRPDDDDGSLICARYDVDHYQNDFSNLCLCKDTIKN